MIRENSDRRIVAAFRFIDAPTETPLQRRFEVAAPGATFIRNRSGMYILTALPGFFDYTREWQNPPDEPAVRSVPLSIEVHDPERRYLSRTITVRLPRDPNPNTPEDPQSLFQPVRVRMFPSPALTTERNWSLIRVTVLRREGNVPAPGALLRVVDRQNAATILGRGLTTSRGEALVAVAGIPFVRSGEGGDVLVRDVPVRLEAFFDPAAAAPPDPDDLELRAAQLETNSTDLSLTAGRTQSVRITVPRENP